MTAACTLSRWDLSITQDRATPAERTAAELYLRMAQRRFDRSLQALSQNDDRLTTAAADAALADVVGLSATSMILFHSKNRPTRTRKSLNNSGMVNSSSAPSSSVAPSARYRCARRR